MNSMTISDAKRRYKQVTCKLLSIRFRKKCDTGEFRTVDGFVVLASRKDETVYLHFRKDPSTKQVYAVIGHPNFTKG